MSDIDPTIESEDTSFDDSRRSDSEAGTRTAKGAQAGKGQEGRAGRLDLDLVMDVPVTMQVVLGSTTMSVAEILELGRGAVVKLDKRVGDPVDVVVNGRVVACGEIVVLDKDDQRFGITLTEVARPGGPRPQGGGPRAG